MRVLSVSILALLCCTAHVHAERGGRGDPRNEYGIERAILQSGGSAAHSPNSVKAPAVAPAAPAAPTAPQAPAVPSAPATPSAPAAAPIKTYSLGVDWRLGAISGQQNERIGWETARRMQALNAARDAVKAQAGKEGVVIAPGMQTSEVARLAGNAGVAPSTADYTLGQLAGAVSTPTAANDLAASDIKADGTGFPYVTKVKDQANCGSCVGFAATAMAESAVALEFGMTSPTLDLSEEWLYFCNGLYNPRCNTGWWPAQAVTVLTSSSSRTSKAEPSEVCFPYNTLNPRKDCTQRCSPLDTTRTRGTFSQPATPFTSTNIDAAKSWLDKGGVLMTTFNVYNDFFSYAPGADFSGVYKWNRSDPLAGGHAVLVVGYNDANGGYWIAKNSWGNGWGFHGYFKIAYGECGFMSGAQDNILGVKFTKADLNAKTY